MPYSKRLPYYPKQYLPRIYLGHPSLYQLAGIGEELGFAAKKIWVCDMSTYPWTCTLKDPRSWAVVGAALAEKIEHLGVWTAGNAGLSIAKAAYMVNGLRGVGTRALTVHAFVSVDEREDVKERLRFSLNRFGAQMHEVDSPTAGSVLKPLRTLRRINTGTEAKVREDVYWDVSDGWDGVGLYMYRLLARQVCEHVKPKYVVAPVGTGDLFYGFYLGMRDWQGASRAAQPECKMVAALPYGLHTVLQNYERIGVRFSNVEPTDDSETTPKAAKLATGYTPLLLPMRAALHDSILYEVTGKTQDGTMEKLGRPQERPDFLACEPSASLAFGVLKKLSALSLRGKYVASQGEHLSLDRVLVVNSGCGWLRPDEHPVRVGRK